MIKLLFYLMVMTAAGYSEITVASAANMQFALKEIIEDYQTYSGNKVKTVFGASGKLAAQIMNGAPYDIFISGDMSIPDSLFRKKFAVQKPQSYARGKLILWSTKNINLDSELKILKSTQVKTIAVGDPKLTAYGPAAISVLKRKGMYPNIQPKLVYGDNISIVAQYIISGSADVGFANLSFVKSGPMAGKGKYLLIDSALYDPIDQGASLLKYGSDNNKTEAESFLRFLFSEESKKVLRKHGYETP